MRIGLPFRSAPSTEFTQPHLDGLQYVWKRVAEHVVDRGDTYKREGFNGMHDESRVIDADRYADLRVSHDMLSMERDGLTAALGEPASLTAELVSRAYTYKSKAKMLYKNVLKALETAEKQPLPALSPPNALGLFRFPSESATSVTLTDSSVYGSHLDLLKSRL
ncbi:hypothetical protein PsYK624_089410 [Phanerochaete sordida]|uniref:Uncharacterized protein n=1 Tax=Phanerochaete sordida TaxID=48140 RepID=A0A9P3LFM1_9APHY|nr:hypothetical protein PsYK624_089410 [Phanerochaete sordida]